MKDDAISFKEFKDLGALNVMTLRDYFAAKAMQGRLANGCNNDADTSIFEATICYQIADAMLKEREKK